MDDHPLRFALANELHARPFPVMGCPGRAVYIAIKQPIDAVKRDRDADRAHLIALLDRYGAPHPQPGATHYFGDLGKTHLKWESHTEFVTYTAYSDGVSDRAFDPTHWEVFPEDWLAEAPGACLTSAHIHIAAPTTDMDAIAGHLTDWFVPESLATSRVLDGTAIIAGDFRISSSGHMQFAVFPRAETGHRRIGRIVQRICEIETYKTMSMLGLPRAREVGATLGPIEESLGDLTATMAGDLSRPDETLSKLLETAATLENEMAQSSFRFAATRAYEAIVAQRIEVLREERFNGRQTFGEFMMRRFDPAMRTVQAT